MFAQMSGQHLAVESSAGLNAEIIRKSNVRGAADISALASLDKNKLAVLVWHYHDDDVPAPDAAIELALNGLPVTNGAATLTHYRIDADHSNAYAAWRRMGSPLPLTDAQFAELEQAGQLTILGQPAAVTVQNRQTQVKFVLPRQGVSLLVLTWP